MIGRSIWKGYLHFKDIELGVKLYTAVREERIGFHLLHRRDHTRLQQQMVCAYEKTPVSSDDQISGFELEDGRYLLIEPSELEHFTPEETREIDVHEFVPSDQLDPVYIERTYQLEPENPSKRYEALVTVMSENDVMGICTWTMRKRSYLGAVGAGGTGLRLYTLRYADEVIDTGQLDLPEVAATERELEIGSHLVRELTGPFEPEKFKDEHQVKLMHLIHQKAGGKKIALLRPRQLKPTASDKLLQTLKASLKKVA